MADARRTGADVLEDRVEEVAVRLLRLVGSIADEKMPEGWVGIELALGLGAALKAFCKEVGYDVERVLAQVSAPELGFKGGSA